ncbi:hypothetical protein BURKHO8Y_240256 [Burkholderia sp. 8Y]|nr:hypothetical protein BURKHO8Y_240256 [Burkholderia sp. 8Y]
MLLRDEGGQVSGICVDNGEPQDGQRLVYFPGLSVRDNLRTSLRFFS